MTAPDGEGFRGGSGDGVCRRSLRLPKNKSPATHVDACARQLRGQGFDSPRLQPPKAIGQTLQPNGYPGSIRRDSLPEMRESSRGAIGRYFLQESVPLRNFVRSYYGRLDLLHTAENGSCRLRPHQMLRKNARERCSRGPRSILFHPVCHSIPPPGLRGCRFSPSRSADFASPVISPPFSSG